MVGFVTNQDPNQAYDKTRPIASRTVCEREVCLRNAKRWVAAETNERAEFYPFGPYPRGEAS